MADRVGSQSKSKPRNYEASLCELLYSTSFWGGFHKGSPYLGLVLGDIQIAWIKSKVRMSNWF